jgi:hypothetical protein
MRSKSPLHPGNAGLGLDHMSAGDKLALAMIPEIDIWRAASLMLKRYGEKALEESAARADELFRRAGSRRRRRVAPNHRRSPPARQHEAVWPAPLTTLPRISFRSWIDPARRPPLAPGLYS